MPGPRSLTEKTTSAMPSRRQFERDGRSRPAQKFAALESSFDEDLLQAAAGSATIGAETGRRGDRQRHAAFLQPVGDLHGHVVEQVVEVAISE